MTHIPNTLKSAKTSNVSVQRKRMIDDMTLAGLSEATQKLYIAAVRRLAARYKKSPDQLTEEEVRTHLLELRNSGVARGTFKTNHYGIRFYYCQSLNRDWALFGKKRFVSRSRNGCLSYCRMAGFVISSATSPIIGIGSAFP